MGSPQKWRDCWGKLDGWREVGSMTPHSPFDGNGTKPNPSFSFSSRISAKQIVSLVKQRYARHTRLCLMSARRPISSQPTRLGLLVCLTSSRNLLPVHRIPTPQRWVLQSDSPHPRLRSESQGRHREQPQVHLGRNLRHSLRW